jgi:hypothetical protein
VVGKLDFREVAGVLLAPEEDQAGKALPGKIEKPQAPGEGCDHEEACEDPQASRPGIEKWFESRH